MKKVFWWWVRMWVKFNNYFTREKYIRFLDICEWKPLLKEGSRQMSKIVLNHLILISLTDKFGAWVPHYSMNKTKKFKSFNLSLSLYYQPICGLKQRFYTVSEDEKWCLYSKKKVAPEDIPKPRIKPNFLFGRTLRRRWTRKCSKRLPLSTQSFILSSYTA